MKKLTPCSPCLVVFYFQCPFLAKQALKVSSSSWFQAFKHSASPVLRTSQTQASHAFLSRAMCQEKGDDLLLSGDRYVC